MKNVGSLSLDKGKHGNQELKIFDAVCSCDVSCPIFEQCLYQCEGNKCKLRKLYVENVVETLIEVLGEKGRPIDWHKIGFFLVPLYCSLIAFKISIYSRNNPLNISPKGGVSVHPSYREIRETIKLINSLLNEIGVDQTERKGFLTGDSNYYDNFVNSGERPI